MHKSLHTNFYIRDICCSDKDCESLKCSKGHCVQSECKRDVSEKSGFLETLEYGHAWKHWSDITFGWNIGEMALFSCQEGYYNPKYPLRTYEVAICITNHSTGASDTPPDWTGLDGTSLAKCVPGRKIIIYTQAFYFSFSAKCGFDFAETLSFDFENAPIFPTKIDYFCNSFIQI